VPFVEGASREWSGDIVNGPARSSPRSAPARPIPTTSPRRSSSRRGRRRRHGDGRHRGHLQLLRRQGEDRHRPPSRRRMRDVRAKGEPVGHVTTGEYGSQMLSLGGVNHLTHGGKKEGRVTCETLLDLCNGKAVELSSTAARAVVQPASRRSSTASSRSACASAAARRRSACSPAMVRQGRRGGRGRRSHHRRAVRASGGQAAGRARHRHQA
jgi:hypothetical protein